MLSSTFVLDAIELLQPVDILDPLRLILLSLVVGIVFEGLVVCPGHWWDRSWTVEDLGDLLEHSTSGLWVEEVDADDRDDEDTDVDEVVLPGQGLEGNRVDILVEEEGGGDEEVEHGQSLSSKGEWQDLDRVCDCQTRESNV